jgi:hypothetical protein
MFILSLIDAFNYPKRMFSGLQNKGEIEPLFSTENWSHFKTPAFILFKNTKIQRFDCLEIPTNVHTPIC